MNGGIASMGNYHASFTVGVITEAMVAMASGGFILKD
jgi:hypothetical protein